MVLPLLPTEAIEGAGIFLGEGDKSQPLSKAPSLAILLAETGAIPGALDDKI